MNEGEGRGGGGEGRPERGGNRGNNGNLLLPPPPCVTLMHKYKDLPLLRGFPLAFRTGQFFAVGTVLCVEGCLAASLASVHEIRAASTSS